MRSSLKSLSMALIAASAIYSSGVMAADKDTKSDNLRPVGEAVDCIYRPSIQHTEVRNDRTIDFHMNGSKIYRNTLPNSCPSLGSERKFSYKTRSEEHTSELQSLMRISYAVFCLKKTNK